MNPFIGPPPPLPFFWGPHPATDEDLDLESEPEIGSPKARQSSKFKAPDKMEPLKIYKTNI